MTGVVITKYPGIAEQGWLLLFRLLNNKIYYATPAKNWESGQHLK